MTKAKKCHGMQELGCQHRRERVISATRIAPGNAALAKYQRPAATVSAKRHGLLGL